MERKTIKQWLLSTNGWQRLWLVCSAICFIYYLVIFPISEANQGSSFRYEMKWATEREMKNPMCAPYMNGDFERLIEPKFSTDGSTCYNIYVHRKYLEGNKPVSELAYSNHFKSEERERWLTYIGMGLVLAIFLSAFVYAVGLVVSWIIKGFKK